MKYLVSHQGLALGHLAIDEILQKVRTKEIDLFDYVFDEVKQDWVLLMEFPELAAKLRSGKPPRPPQISTTAPAPVLEPVVATKPVVSAHAISDWYVLKGENRFGPFTYTDLVKMLQQKVIFPFDFIWHSGLSEWQRAVEIKDFSSDEIRELFSRSKKKQDLFTERKFPRKEYLGPVLVHDNLSLWKGKGFEISRGGVGINMSNTLVVPGQRVFIHFGKYEQWPAFNAVCEVVSKKFVNDTSPVQYGLRFLSLTHDVQDDFYRKVA